MKRTFAFMPNSRFLLPAFLLTLITSFMAFSGIASSTGISFSGEAVTLNLGEATPQRPLVWPDAIQLVLQSNAPWYLTVKGDNPLSGPDNRQIPLSRLSWSLMENGEAGAWTPVSETEQIVAAGELPTGSGGQSVSIGLRFQPAWSDPPGGPYRSAVHLTLSGGTDLTPSYVFPQPVIAGESATVVFYADGLAGEPDLPVCLEVFSPAGAVVAAINGMASPAGWSTLVWSGTEQIGETGQNNVIPSPGRYRYTVKAGTGRLFAQGAFTVAARQALPAPGVIHGKVEADGQAISGAAVYLYDDTGQLIAANTSSHVGEFQFAALALGAYTVEVRYPGYLVWRSKRIHLDEGQMEHTVVAELSPNNALFVNASIRIISAFHDAAAAKAHSGDVVELQGRVRNTGTRTLRMPVLKVHWPAGLWPANVVADAADQNQMVQLPDLLPGEEYAFRLVAVVGMSASPAGEGRASLLPEHTYVEVNAHAWADDGSGRLHKVDAPPRFVALDIVRESFITGGQLALYVYWDTDGDKQPDADEPAATGLHLQVAGGMPRGTSSGTSSGSSSRDEVITGPDGWVLLPVHAGPVTLFISDDESLDGWRTLYATTMLPGAVNVASIALAPNKPVGAQHQSGAVFSYAPGDQPAWQGAGEVQLYRENWSVGWRPPYQLRAQFSPAETTDGLEQNHAWLLDASVERPKAGWRIVAGEQPSSGVQPAELQVAVAMGEQALERQARFALQGTGPYRLPSPAFSISSVTLQRGACRLVVSDADYTFDPTGMLWLAQPPGNLWANANGDCRVHTGETDPPGELLISYISADQGTAASEPAWAASIRAHPRRDDASSADKLTETFGFSWMQPWHVPEAGIWRLLWERESPGGTFRWEGGTLADPGADPVKTVLNSPSAQIPVCGDEHIALNSSHAADPANPAVWLPYERVEQSVHQDNWQLLLGHMRAGTNTKDYATVGRVSEGGQQGSITLSRWRWPVVGGEGTQLDLTARLTGEHHGWQWRVEQQWPLWQQGGSYQAANQQEHRTGISGDAFAFDPSPAMAFAPATQSGQVRVSWRDPATQAPGFGVWLDTATGKIASEAFWERQVLPNARVQTAVVAQETGVSPRAVFDWHTGANAGKPASLQLMFSAAAAGETAFQSSLRLDRWLAGWSITPVSAGREQVTQVGYEFAASPESYGDVSLRYTKRPLSGTSGLSSQIVWAGPLQWLGVGWSGGAHLHVGAQRITNPELATVTASAGASIRRSFDTVAVSTGVNWPWQSITWHNGVAGTGTVSTRPTPWVALEKRIAQWADAGIWGGIAVLHTTAGWEPRLQLRLQ